MQLFESANISMRFKQAIESNKYKYIIGSLAGRCESMVKSGVKKLPSPIVVSLDSSMIDYAINEKKQSLYLQFYLNCGSEVFCLLKHKQIKVKSGEYSYHVEEQLGKIERNEKKPTKPSFKLGVLVSTKYLVLDTSNFTRKFIKYRNRDIAKDDGSILCWVESNSFQSATRDEICKPKGGTKHTLDSESNNSSDDIFERVKQIKLEFEQTVEKQIKLKAEMEEKLAILSDMLKDSTSNESSPVRSVQSVSNPPNTPIYMDDIFGLTSDNAVMHLFQSFEFNGSYQPQQQDESDQLVPTVLPDTSFNPKQI